MQTLTIQLVDSKTKKSITLWGVKSSGRISELELQISELRSLLKKANDTIAYQAKVIGDLQIQLSQKSLTRNSSNSHLPPVKRFSICDKEKSVFTREEY